MPTWRVYEAYLALERRTWDWMELLAMLVAVFVAGFCLGKWL